jgi:phospho-N-acetylmuramoyl-pentapeptide-transferase
MGEVLIGGTAALLICMFLSPRFIEALRNREFGQHIREEGPEGHHVKAGTPTMGGIVIVAGTVAGYVAGHGQGQIFTWGALAVMAALIGAGLTGLADDWIKVRKERSLGLNKRAKVAGQLGAAGIFCLIAVRYAHVRTNLSFTRWDALTVNPMPTWAWVIWAVLLIVGTSNAVNLADGLDGLAAGSSTFALSALAIIGFWQFRHPEVYAVPQALDLALVAIAMTGGCVGFLWWNAAPARIFMGDIGALAIGAGIAALSLVMNLQLLLPILGALFVLITLSVIIQVASFQLFHRRVFRMAPLHHHFELVGWPETTVIIRFWILAGLATALALAIFYADFISLGLID